MPFLNQERFLLSMMISDSKDRPRGSSINFERTECKEQAIRFVHENREHWKQFDGGIE